MRDHIGVRVNKLIGLPDQAVRVIMASDEVAPVFKADELIPEKWAVALTMKPDDIGPDLNLRFGLRFEWLQSQSVTQSKHIVNVLRRLNLYGYAA